MIQRVPAGADARQFTWLLAPNRALSRDELRKAIGALAAAAMLTALLAAWQGNVFAPLFALLEVPCVAVAFVLAWRAGDRGERITLDARSVRVESLPSRAAAVAFPSAWVRVHLRDWGGHRHVLLAASGREREVGAFLGDDERLELSEELKSALAGVTETRNRDQG
ncbi:MAG TPA: DUF2244 domain-containing protein [Rhodanobacteraceae bacterium]|nr:DUF2244 domain-containing protein [Rhodanobacteraceae bacterium]